MDSSISNDTGDSGQGNESEICAPLDAFAINGTPPAVGDKVEFKTEGTVTRVEGGNAYVTPDTVNGQQVMHDQGDQGEPDENALRQNAQNIDRQQYAQGGLVPPVTVGMRKKIAAPYDRPWAPGVPAGPTGSRGAIIPPNVTSRLKKGIKSSTYDPYGP
jgi:hypothetical protein